MNLNVSMWTESDSRFPHRSIVVFHPLIAAAAAAAVVVAAAVAASIVAASQVAASPFGQRLVQLGRPGPCD